MIPDRINPYDSRSLDPAAAHTASAPSRWPRRLAWCAAGYYLLSALTLPWADRVWLGELPLLAVIQLPKIWLKGTIHHGLMFLLQTLGLSRGSFSPDYLATQWLAIALTVVGPALLLIALLSCWPRLPDRHRLVAIVLLTALLDAAITVSVTRWSHLSLF